MASVAARIGVLVSLAAAPLAAQTRDSAGITIIESSPARARDLAPVRVAERPTLQIGVESGDRNQQFNRITAAVRLGDGSIVVADRGSGEIRIFDVSGRFVRKVRRKGQGPGEFFDLYDVRALESDSLVAWDGTGRFTVFTPNGEVTRTFTAQGGPRSERQFGLVRGTSRDGGFFGYRVARQPPPPIKAIARDTVHVALYTRDGAYVRAVGDFLNLQVLLHMGGTMQAPNGQRAAAWSVTGVPFARETYLRAGADWLWVGTGESYELMGFDRTGSLRRIIRIREAAQRVTPEIIARHRKEPRRRDSPARPNVDVKIDASWYPKTLPAYAAIRVDGAQRLWVRDYPLPGEKQPRWRVFDRDGALLGHVVTPPGLDVLEIGTDYLLGVWLDELDVEYVRVYAISAGT